MERRGEHESRGKPFDDFLLSEYNNIAQAHFNTIDTISAFFRYYLIIVAFPLTLYSAVFGLLREGGQLTDLLGILAAIVSLLIAIVGVFVLIYIINLRMDAILYARTVNGIRKHFYDKADLEIDPKLRTRVLPQSAAIPMYLEKWFFLPVVLSFASFNTVYLFLFFFLWFTPLTAILGFTGQLLNLVMDAVIRYLIPVILFLVFQIGVYIYLTRYRELSYLKSFGIGIDIDGVLNNHRPHFCKLLKKHTRIELDPRQITTIPVHEIKGLGITRKDEGKVFNDPLYWTKMPCLHGAAENIKRLRNAFKLKIYIFTYRPWPNQDPRDRGSSDKDWRKIASEEQSNLPRTIRELEPIDAITRSWLKSREIVYDHLIVERGSDDVSDPRGEFRNRFYISRRKMLRFFVEDDPEKANKLAYICDIVFLMKQPYNNRQELPSNVLRVASWDEIYRSIRRLS